MDTDNPHNFLLVDEIRRQATASSLLEAYLESAPQIILQIYFVIEFYGERLKDDSWWLFFQSKFKYSQ
jgi:hypothetical protein